MDYVAKGMIASLLQRQGQACWNMFRPAKRCACFGGAHCRGACHEYSPRLQTCYSRRHTLRHRACRCRYLRTLIHREAEVVYSAALHPWCAGYLPCAGVVQVRAIQYRRGIFFHRRFHETCMSGAMSPMRRVPPDRCAPDLLLPGVRGSCPQCDFHGAL